MTAWACILKLGTSFSVRPTLSGDGIPSIAPIEGVDLDSLSDMSETDRAKAMFNQLKQVSTTDFGGNVEFHREIYTGRSIWSESRD